MLIYLFLQLQPAKPLHYWSNKWVMKHLKTINNEINDLLNFPTLYLKLYLASKPFTYVS